MLGIYFIKECPLLCLQALLQNMFEPIPNQAMRAHLRREQRAAMDAMQEQVIQLPAQRHRQIENHDIPAVLRSLNKESFDMKKFQHETHCVICLNEYEETD